MKLKHCSIIDKAFHSFFDKVLPLYKKEERQTVIERCLIQMRQRNDLVLFDDITCELSNFLQSKVVDKERFKKNFEEFKNTLKDLHLNLLKSTKCDDCKEGKDHGTVFDIKSNELKYRDVCYKVENYMLPYAQKSPDDCVKVFMAYTSIGYSTSSYQWGETKEMFDYYYNNLYIRYEGFASPFNSGLLRLNKPDIHFCSLFYEHDKIFGGIGDFFEMPYMKSDHQYLGVTVNPPYIESILDKTSETILRILSDTNKSVLFLLFLPNWKDNRGIMMLRKSRYLLFFHEYEKRTCNVTMNHKRTFRPSCKFLHIAVGRRVPTIVLDALQKIAEVNKSLGS